MPSEYDPLDALADIIENAERIETYLAGMDRQAFERDGKTRDAVNAVWSVFAKLHTDWAGAQSSLCPAKPWADIRGTGNRLRHAYDRLDLDIVWNTARDRLPSLASDARRALADIEGTTE